MPNLSEADMQSAAKRVADPALDNWVAMQDVAAEVEPFLSANTWDNLDRGAIEILHWMEHRDLIRVGQYSNSEGLIYWPEHGDALKQRLLDELNTTTDRVSNRMNTMLCLTKSGLEWAKEVTGRSTSAVIRPAK